MGSAKTTGGFIPPMLLLKRERLPEGADWLYELKLDGYRALAIKTGSKVHLRSRNARYPRIVKALANLPDETVIDGEIVALDEDGRPVFKSVHSLRPTKNDKSINKHRFVDWLQKRIL